MSVLVFGGYGQVGSELRAYAERHQLALITPNSTNCNITDHAAIKRIVEKYQPSAIINCAAYTAVDKAESEPEIVFACNRDGADYIAQVCSEHKIPLIHLSTDYVFDGSKPQAYVESDWPQPLNVYGLSKFQAEQKIQEKCDQHIILRVSWVFGQFGNNFIKTILRLGQSKEELRIVQDQIGQPTYAGDIAKTIFKILEKINLGVTEWGIYHYAGRTATTWHDLAWQVLATSPLKSKFMTKSIIPIPTSDYPTPATRPLNSRLNCGKIGQVYGIEPADWRLGLQYMLKVLA